MLNNRSFFLACLTLILYGCAAQKTLQPIDGSKSDGTVSLGFEYGGFEQANWDWGQGQLTAINRCKSWGYSGAERFNNGMQTCIARNQYGCLRYRVTVQYQCTGESYTARNSINNTNSSGVQVSSQSNTIPIGTKSIWGKSAY